MILAVDERGEGHVARRRADEHDVSLVGGQLERIEDGFRRARGIEDVVEWDIVNRFFNQGIMRVVPEMLDTVYNLSDT